MVARVAPDFHPIKQSRYSRHVAEELSNLWGHPATLSTFIPHALILRGEFAGDVPHDRGDSSVEGLRVADARESRRPWYCCVSKRNVFEVESSALLFEARVTVETASTFQKSDTSHLFQGLLFLIMIYLI